MVYGLGFNPFFGPGTTNQVVPGYGITMPPVNFCAWRATGRGAVRDFGFENQYVTYPPGYPPLAYFLANNPQMMYTNPLLLGILNGGNTCGCNYYA